MMVGELIPTQGVAELAAGGALLTEFRRAALRGREQNSATVTPMLRRYLLRTRLECQNDHPGISRTAAAETT
jgi:hypothetical protein